MDVEPDLGEDANRPVEVGAGAASVAWNLSAPGRDKGIPTGVIIGGLLVLGIGGYLLLKK